MRTSTRLTLPFLYALLAAGCSNSNDNLPKDYIGFERKADVHSYDTNHEEETVTVKIVAGDKQDKDRKLTLTSNQTPNVFKIKDPNPVIHKGKKSVKVNVTIYPTKINWEQRIIHLICKPDGKDAKVSEMTIRLQKK